MTSNGTPPDAGLPVALEPRRAPTFVPRAADCAFVSQLIAERDRLPSQSEKRQAPMGTAIDAYSEGERRGGRRLPQGFFRSAEA